MVFHAPTRINVKILSGSPMVGYLVKRIISIFFVMLVVSVIVFFLMSLVPGGPYNLGDRGYSGVTLANAQHKYGLDVPIPVRYLSLIHI